MPGFPPWPNEPRTYAIEAPIDAPCYDAKQVEAMMRAYGAAVREACAKHIEGMCGGQFRAAGWEIAASIRQED